MSENSLDAIGFIEAPIELVRELVGRYVDEGHNRAFMRQIVAFVLSVLVERTLIAQLTNSTCVQIGDSSLTLDEAREKIMALQSLPVF